MEQITKEKVITEIKELYNDIDKCISDLITARGNRDGNGISNAHWRMETLMVNTQQAICNVIDTFETKEVNLEDYISGIIDYPFPKFDFPNIYPNYKELKNYCNRKSIKDGDRVRLIIIKEK